MKKILSLTLALLMVVSAVPMVYAATPCFECSNELCITCGGCATCGTCTCNAEPENNWEGGTQVTYTATGAEEWTVTVPATLTPGNAGDVTAAGTWGSNRKLVVTADDNVTLTNSINAADQKVLDVTFADINLVGDNTQAVSETKQVSVAAMPADALFGTWSGTFYYDVEMVDNVQLITFTINGTEYQAEDGMTWAEWVESDYNVGEIYLDYIMDPAQAESGEPRTVYMNGGYLSTSEDIADGEIETNVIEPIPYYV